MLYIVRLKTYEKPLVKLAKNSKNQGGLKKMFRQKLMNSHLFRIISLVILMAFTGSIAYPGLSFAEPFSFEDTLRPKSTAENEVARQELLNAFGVEEDVEEIAEEPKITQFPLSPQDKTLGMVARFSEMQRLWASPDSGEDVFYDEKTRGLRVHKKSLRAGVARLTRLGGVKQIPLFSLLADFIREHASEFTLTPDGTSLERVTADTPDFGYKLYLQATKDDAAAVLRDLLPYLFEPKGFDEDIFFRCVVNEDQLAQVPDGTLITIYPPGNSMIEQRLNAFTIAKALDDLFLNANLEMDPSAGLLAQPYRKVVGESGRVRAKWDSMTEEAADALVQIRTEAAFLDARNKSPLNNVEVATPLEDYLAEFGAEQLATFLPILPSEDGEEVARFTESNKTAEAVVEDDEDISGLPSYTESEWQIATEALGREPVLSRAEDEIGMMMTMVAQHGWTLEEAARYYAKAEQEAATRESLSDTNALPEWQDEETTSTYTEDEWRTVTTEFMEVLGRAPIVSWREDEMWQVKQYAQEGKTGLRAAARKYAEEELAYRRRGMQTERDEMGEVARFTEAVAIDANGAHPLIAIAKHAKSNGDFFAARDGDFFTGQGRIMKVTNSTSTATRFWLARAKGVKYGVKINATMEGYQAHTRWYFDHDDTLYVRMGPRDYGESVGDRRRIAAARKICEAAAAAEVSQARYAEASEVPPAEPVMTVMKEAGLGTRVVRIPDEFVPLATDKTPVRVLKEAGFATRLVSKTPAKPTDVEDADATRFSEATTLPQVNRITASRITQATTGLTVDELVGIINSGVGLQAAIEDIANMSEFDIDLALPEVRKQVNDAAWGNLIDTIENQAQTDLTQLKPRIARSPWGSNYTRLSEAASKVQGGNFFSVVLKSSLGSILDDRAILRERAAEYDITLQDITVATIDNLEAAVQQMASELNQKGTQRACFFLGAIPKELQDRVTKLAEQLREQNPNIINLNIIFAPTPLENPITAQPDVVSYMQAFTEGFSSNQLVTLLTRGLRLPSGLLGELGQVMRQLDLAEILRNI